MVNGVLCRVHRGDSGSGIAEVSAILSILVSSRHCGRASGHVVCVVV